MFGVLLDREGLKHLAITIGDWTRENFTVTEGASGQQYRFVVPGPSVRTKEFNGCLEEIAEIDPIPDFIVASGSLSPNVPPDFYARLAKRVRDKGTFFVLDTSAVALRESLRVGGIYLVKPSMRELRESVGQELLHESEQEKAALQIVNKGQAEIVVVSIGAAGALLVTRDGANPLRRLSTTLSAVESNNGGSS